MTDLNWPELFRRLFEALLSPFFMICMVVFFLLCYLMYHAQKRWIKGLALISLLILFLITTPWLPHFLIDRLESVYPKQQVLNPGIQWVVVLGGGVYEIDLPSYEVLSGISMKRVSHGVALMKQLPNAKLIVSGGSSRHTGITVGQKMAEFARELGVKSEDMIIEPYSINTADEAQFVREYVGKDPFYLVTSALHMQRSMYLFKQKGLTPIAMPCQYTYFWTTHPNIGTYFPNARNLDYFASVWHEILGFIWAKATV